MGDLLMGLIVGFVAAVILMCFLLFVVTRRLRLRHAEETSRYDESITDLRQERAEDKETNRRLRHELVSLSPDRLVEATTNAEFERDNALSERDQALEQLHLMQQDFGVANRRLADQESKLRQYREALKEIRISLEAQDRERSMLMPAAADNLIDTDTDEVPAEALLRLQADPPIAPVAPVPIELHPEPADASVSD